LVVPSFFHQSNFKLPEDFFVRSIIACILVDKNTETFFKKKVAGVVVWVTFYALHLE